jgi:hypothetical protein
MDSRLTRRQVLQTTLALSPLAITGCATTPDSDAGPKPGSYRPNRRELTAEDPVARSLAFYPNTADVPADHPLVTDHDVSQRCANCLHQRGPAGEGVLRCPSFPGRNVSENGWCSLWTKA